MEKEEAAAELRAQWEEADEAGRAELEEQKKALEREEEKFRRDMQQQAEEQTRALDNQIRTEFTLTMDEAFRIADEERGYYDKLLGYNEMKLEFYW